MESGNAPKEILKSFIDLASMAKGLMDENQQSSFQRDLERLFPSTRGGGERVESREPHRVGAGESSASTTTDINTNFTIRSSTKRAIGEIYGSKACGDSQQICYFFPCKIQ